MKPTILFFFFNLNPISFLPPHLGCDTPMFSLSWASVFLALHLSEFRQTFFSWGVSVQSRQPESHLSIPTLALFILVLVGLLVSQSQGKAEAFFDSLVRGLTQIWLGAHGPPSPASLEWALQVLPPCTLSGDASRALFIFLNVVLFKTLASLVIHYLNVLKKEKQAPWLEVWWNVLEMG